MEPSGAHCRLAIGMMGVFGISSDRQMLMGFMSVSTLLSVWISNAATVPAVMGARFAFMLPVGTALNTIVLGSRHITAARMAREGLLIKLLSVAVISRVCFVSLS